MRLITVQFKTWLIYYLLSPFSWSKWADICTFSFAHRAYLLQGRVNYKSNAKRFRVTATKKLIGTAYVGNVSMARLIECGLIDEHVKPINTGEKGDSLK